LKFLTLLTNYLYKSTSYLCNSYIFCFNDKNRSKNRVRWKLFSLSNYEGLKSSPNYALDLNGKYKPKIVGKNRTDKKIQISKFNFLNLNFHHQFNFWLRVRTILYVIVSITNNLRTQLHHSGNKWEHKILNEWCVAKW
jgi:hypothetical protein